jgi:hypothetical protein
MIQVTDATTAVTVNADRFEGEKMMKIENPIVVLATLSVLLLPVYTLATEVEGKTFSKLVKVENTSLKLVGTGLLRYFGFKAYVGALYIEEKNNLDTLFSDTAKRIEIEYMRSIKGSDFGPATIKSLKKNIDEETYNRLSGRIEHHNSLYEDVQPGDRYALTYVPGKGTELTLNGKPKGVIRGADFAAAIFTIWVGPRPISESFKEQILGLS